MQAFCFFVGTFAGGLIQGATVKELFVVLWKTVKQLKKTFITVICLVGLSTVMDTSGMISVIATALATITEIFIPFCTDNRLLGHIYYR